jgi:choline dehydrogenase-like flavoprotein
MQVAVIGSGPSGVAAATALLEAGHRVDILDVGYEPGPEAEELAGRIRRRVGDGLSVDSEILRALKWGKGRSRGIRHGLGALLGSGLEAERGAKRIYGSTFVFAGAESGIPLENAVIPLSLAKGGLSNAWGAACYPLREADYQDWPLTPNELAPYYERASALLGIVQHEDDLARAYPLHGPATATGPRNPGSPAERLLARWSRCQSELAGYGLAAGRARLAVRPEGSEGDACRRCGLCYYGCAYGAIYNSRHTLERLARREGFAYRSGLLVLDFREDEHKVTVRSRSIATERVERGSYDALFLAAGTLSSLRIAADSLRIYDQPAPLLDNDLYLVPVFLTRDRISSRFRTSFTLAEAVLALDRGVVAPHGLHIQFYSFQEYFLAELGGLLAALPEVAQRPAWALLNNFIIAFAYLSGRDSVIAKARVQEGKDGEAIGRVRIDTTPNPESRGILKRAFRHLRRARSQLGFVPFLPLAKKTPLGFGGHLAGTLPMRTDPGPLETTRHGVLCGTRRVHVVDAAAYPALPAQNLTFTTMANAMRVADAFSKRLDP